MLRVVLAVGLVVSVGACGGDDGAGDVPPISAACDTPSCATGASNNIAFFVYLVEDCTAARANPAATTEVAGRGAPMTCAGGSCEASSDDSPSDWDDEDDVVVASIPAATYGVLAWFDHNGNILTGVGPDSGDTLCCGDIPINDTTTDVGLAPGSCEDVP